MKPIYLVTNESLAELSLDDQILSDRIRSMGWPAIPQVWSDPNVNWGTAAVVLLRSTWDYHKRPAEFLDWVDRADQQTRVLNPPSLLRWNFHKSYLRDLANNGISIIPTIFVSQTHPCKAADLADRHGWDSCVVKPAVSCDAFSTTVFRNIASSATREQIDAHLEAVLCFSDALIQPIIEEVFIDGEISLVFLAGQYSHAVRKVVAEQRLGVAIRRIAYDPTPEESQVGANVLRVLGDAPAYCRVDLVRSGRHLLLMELELIEPSLHFSLAPGSAAKFAAYLIGEAKRGRPNQGRRDRVAR